MLSDPQGWRERLDAQLKITFPHDELHPAQVGQLYKFVAAEIREAVGRVRVEVLPLKECNAPECTKCGIQEGFKAAVEALEAAKDKVKGEYE